MFHQELRASFMQLRPTRAAIWRVSYSGLVISQPNSAQKDRKLSSRRAARSLLRVMFTSKDGLTPQVRNLKQLAFFPRLGIALNRLQKNGSSSAMSFLYFLEHGQQMPALEAKGLSIHLGDLGVRGVIALKRAKRIVIVRDPFSRTLSAFLDKFRSPYFQRDFGPFDLTPEGFSGFLAYLEDGGLRTNSHWSPQTDRLLLAPEQYDAVVSFSSFPDAFLRVLERWVPDVGQKWADFSQDKIQGPPRTDAGAKVAAFYNEDDIARVECLYGKDLTVPPIRAAADTILSEYERLHSR